MEIEKIGEICTGCSACRDICPRKAIAMQPDTWGYIRPEIDHSACVECGLCDKVCPEIHPVELHNPASVMAVMDRAVGEIPSSSGGAAYSIARSFTGTGGVVYGCTQSSDGVIAHTRITESEELTQMKGSKYVQSPTETTYTQCRADLNAGKKVVYTGTPCQIAGLRKFLGMEYPNLCTIDLVCHGVPSQQLLSDELKYLNRHNTLPENMRVEFRDKSSGKVKFGFYIFEGKNKVYGRDYPRNFYISGFMSGLFFRPNCFKCRYASQKRVGNITLGDFWGLGKERPSEMNPSAGVSLVMVNTPKGEAVMQSVKDMWKYEERSVQEAAEGNTQLRHPFARPADYEAFHSFYQKEGYEAACRKYLCSYIRENRMYMLIEEHPLLMLPYRIYLKIKGMIK